MKAKTREGGGRMGRKTEAREQQKAGGGGSIVASAAAVIPLLRGSAAGGCAEGRSVEKTEERRTGGKERKGVPGQHCNSCSCSSLSGRKEGEKETQGRKGCRIALEEAFLSMFLHKEKGLIRKPDFSLADAFLYGLMQEACLEIV